MDPSPSWTPWRLGGSIPRQTRIPELPHHPRALIPGFHTPGMGVWGFWLSQARREAGFHGIQHGREAGEQSRLCLVWRREGRDGRTFLLEGREPAGAAGII